MNTIVEYPIDNLTKEVFRFHFFERNNKLVLDHYHLMKRETKRHKFRIEKKYERLSYNERGCGANVIDKQDVPLTDAVKDNAKQIFIRSIAVDFEI